MLPRRGFTSYMLMNNLVTNSVPRRIPRVCTRGLIIITRREAPGSVRADPDGFGAINTVRINIVKIRQIESGSLRGASVAEATQNTRRGRNFQRIRARKDAVDKSWIKARKLGEFARDAFETLRQCEERKTGREGGGEKKEEVR